MAFQKGNKLGGRKPGSTNKRKFKFIREQLTDKNVNIVSEAMDLLRKTRDETLKFEIIKFLAEYSQGKPQDTAGSEADVTNISEATLLKLASGDTSALSELDAASDNDDSDALCEGDFDAADAHDSAANDDVVEQSPG